MIVKFVLNSMQDSHIIMCACDSITTSKKEHPYGCGCEACLTFKNEETEKHKCGMLIRSVACYKTAKEPTLYPDGTTKYDSELIMHYALGRDDVCYVLNDDGKTIDKIIG